MADCLGAKSSALLLAAIMGLFIIPAGAARAQPLTVLPVTIPLSPGQMATFLTVINQGNSDTSFQVRAFAWHQEGEGDDLTATDDLLASPPLGTIAAGASQVVRLVLRRPPRDRETTYRILLDQIPPLATPGVVHITLRLSIPVFAEPAIRSSPNLQWQIETDGRQAYLIARNDGGRHETIRDIVLARAFGAPLKVEGNVSPYVLAGALHRWKILTPGRGAAAVPAPGDVVRLTARADSGAVEQAVPVRAAP